MSAQYNSYLCIGGPRAGQRYDADRRFGFRAAVVPPLSVAVGPIPGDKIQAQIVEYRAECFHTETEDIWFWVPQGQSQLQTMNLLLGTYEEHWKHR